MISKNQTRPFTKSQSRQRGAALIVGLVLMLVLTVLGVSGMNMATLELTMANNSQAQQVAFQAAESGIDFAMSGPVNTTGPVTYTSQYLGDGSYEFDASISCAGTSRVPDGAYSEDLSARAIHFDATATGRGPRNAVSVHTQSVYIVGPAPGNPNFNPAVSPGAC
ncbi:MAG: PilX N-terminal domain-containing pilus assembly protein [Gammaproteobacteria bacterium]|nr:PilX N-terminal domain-containing pilus assembly protein [Gammaproteobacteria bacterium]